MKYSVLLLTLCVFSIYPMGLSPNLLEFKINLFKKNSREQGEHNFNDKSPDKKNRKKRKRRDTNQEPSKKRE